MITDVLMKNFISLKEAAHLLGVTKFTLRNLVHRENILNGHMIDGELYFRKDEFEKEKNHLADKLKEEDQS